MAGKDKELADKERKIQDAIRKITEKFNAANRRLAALEAETAQLEREKARVEKEENPYGEMRKQNRANIDKEAAQLDKDAETRKYLKYAEGVVSQDTLRKFIIQDLIGLLNNKIKTYLTRLGSKYTVVFDSDMNYEFQTCGGTYEFGNFSAGEAMRIMIATSFAFRDFMSIRNGLNANILVLDEYFDSAVSSACLESLFRILKDYVRDYGQTVYCISHRQELAPEHFDKVVEVQKTDNISRVSVLS